MPPPFDTIIVGAGLAGACAALYLSRQGRVLVLEARQPASGASGAAAGLVNPLMGRRARPAWRASAALEALHATLEAAEATSLFDRSGVLRPARHAQQADLFRERVAAHPEQAAWLPADAVRARCPGVVCHDGALLVLRGGALPVPAFVEHLLWAARQRGTTTVRTGARVSGWGETADDAFVTLDGGEQLHARHVLLAMGYGYRRHPELTALNLHGVKGQTVRIAVPNGWTLPMPLSGYGYVVPEPATAQTETPTFVVGSSYEHEFYDVQPSRPQTREILAKAARMVPVLAGCRVLEAVAGVRVTVPRSRLPLLGPLPGRSRVWLFTGLGSKGLLMAPLLARDLPRFFKKPSQIPEEVQVRITG